MRVSAGSGVVAALCLGFILGALSLLIFSMANRAEPVEDFVPAEEAYAADASTAVRIQSREYLVRPEAPEVGVNIVKEVHQRAPATDSEAAEWLGAGEMIPVDPGTAVKRVEGKAPGYAVCVEVLNGPRQGLRGWVWEDSLRRSWP